MPAGLMQLILPGTGRGTARSAVEGAPIRGQHGEDLR
jgi:hypothetical protein